MYKTFQNNWFIYTSIDNRALIHKLLGKSPYKDQTETPFPKKFQIPEQHTHIQKSIIQENREYSLPTETF